MKIKTSELTGPALNWAVAKIEGVVYHGPAWTKYSSDWAQGGPIIERYRIGLDFYEDGGHEYGGEWGATTNGGTVHVLGPTPLVAAMRCYVASVLGDEIDIPEGLL